MEEELNYATVDFRNCGPAPKKTKEEETHYAEVKHSANKSSESPDGKAEPHNQPSHLVVACLVVLCVLLVAAIAAIICLTTVISEHSANSNNLTTQNLQLRTEIAGLERQTEELTREKDGLNWTLGVILEFDDFPVNQYCSQKECRPCRDGWVSFQSSCYLFYNDDAPWKTWKASRQYCQEKASDLVIIGSQQEQEFISNHTEYYFDNCHGYWIGLNKTENNWIWVDGSNLTVRYWITKQLGDRGDCTLVIPKADPLANWDEATCTMQNKLICEGKTLIKSN